MSFDEEDLERRLDFIVRELDECMVLAASTETYPLIEGKAIELSQIQTRIQLIISFIVNHQPTKLRIINRG